MYSGLRFQSLTWDLHVILMPVADREIKMKQNTEIYSLVCIFNTQIMMLKQS